MSTTWLPPAHFALSIVILAWDISLAGRIAQMRHAPRSFQALSALCALLLLPALLLSLATTSIITSRAVTTMDWFWPAVLVLYAAQAVYALVRRLVNPLWGAPIAAYNVLIAGLAIIHWGVAHGHENSALMVKLLAAQSMTVTRLTWNPASISSPYYVTMPMISPAFPALRPMTAVLRVGMTAVATGWMVVFATFGIPPAINAIGALQAHANDRLRERPKGDFTIALKVLPDVRRAPDAAAVRSDSALADTLDVDALSVVIVPDASRAAIDSVGHVIDRMRGESTTVIVAIGYRTKLVPELSPFPLGSAQRIATLQLVMRRIRPDIILPAEDPYGVGARALGRLPVGDWEAYLTDAARAAKSIDPRVRVGVSASAFSSSDSALYAWAAAPRSPMDVVGFSLFPSAPNLNALQDAADRWMQTTPPTKDHWVFATGGYPLAYGELNQQRAIWQVLAWATDHAAIKGVVIYEAGDYGEARGLRAPDGRLRPAAFAVMRAIRGLRESAK